MRRSGKVIPRRPFRAPMTDEALARRALARLSASFGLAWVAIAMTAAPGPVAWVALSGDPADAGLFFALFSLSSAVGAAAAGRAMDRLGRRPVLVAAHLLAAAGFAAAGFAYAVGSLGLFAVGTVALASGVGAIYLTRLAAGEMFAPAHRARAVARVQVSATLGALLGPLLLVGSGPLGAVLGRDPVGLVWFLAPPLLGLAALLVARAPEPRALAHVDAAPAPAASAPARRLPALPMTAGIAALVCAQAAMVMVMGVTGVALHHAGHGAGPTGLVMAFHFVGMFGLSLLVGRFADRAGRRRAILLGLAVLAVGGVGVALAGGVFGLGVGLLLVGLGWSFAYIGGTVVLADVVPAARRARVVGLVDFSTAILAAVASFAGGWWYAQRGLSGLGLAAVALVALPLVLALPLRELRPGRYGTDADLA